MNIQIVRAIFYLSLIFRSEISQSEKIGNFFLFNLGMILSMT